MTLSSLQLAVTLVLVLASAVGIAVEGRDVMRKIDAQSNSSADNVQWALSQADVELLQLSIVMDATVQNPAMTPELHKRFDVFYSRIKTLQVGSVFASLHGNPAFSDSFDPLEQFLAATVPIMDGPDADLQTALPALLKQTRALLPYSHAIALTGISVFATRSDVHRAGVKATLILLGVLTMVLVAALAAMLVMVLRLDWGNRQRAAQNAETLSRLDAVINTSRDAVITLNDAGRIVDFNPAASLTFGFSRDIAVGRDLNLLVPPDPQGRAQLPPMHAPLSAGLSRLRITARHMDGHLFPAEVSLTSAKAVAGSVHVVFLRDLSAQVVAEQALVQARDEALAGEKAKADLLVVMSHEIRTPLNGMIGTIELLDSTDLAPHQREYVRIMAASGKLLMHHVNDVLDIARLDSGKSVLSLTPVDLAGVVQEVLENQGPTSQSHGNTLVFVPPDGGPRLVLGDAALVRQVLLNLVGNAVKFTRDGVISVQLLYPESQGLTQIVVHDSGIGISADDLDRIFEDFVTLDPTYARRASGTGLGLGIVRRIVTRMGGQVRVESAAGEGSTFRISLPLTFLHGAGPEAAAALAPLPAPGLNVLVVEDNEFNRLIVRDMLIKDGHSVTVAADGAAGVTLAEAVRFDVVLMDISMPGMDGLQAAQLIRGGQGASRDTPIVALTAHALPEETDRFRTSGGMQDVLTKPVTRDMLRAVLARLPFGPMRTDAENRTAQPWFARDQTAGALIDLEVWVQMREALGAFRAKELVARFLTDTDRRIGELAMRATGPDAQPDLIGDVHRLGGSAAMFGAAAFHKRLTAIEVMFKRGDRAAARSELPDLAELWYRTAAAYRAEGDLAQASSLR